MRWLPASRPSAGASDLAAGRVGGARPTSRAPLSDGTPWTCIERHQDVWLGAALVRQTSASKVASHATAAGVDATLLQTTQRMAELPGCQAIKGEVFMKYIGLSCLPAGSAHRAGHCSCSNMSHRSIGYRKGIKLLCSPVGPRVHRRDARIRALQAHATSPLTNTASGLTKDLFKQRCPPVGRPCTAAHRQDPHSEGSCRRGPRPRNRPGGQQHRRPRHPPRRYARLPAARTAAATPPLRDRNIYASVRIADLSANPGN